MADKNIQMTQRDSANTGWDNLYPITKAGNVNITGGTLETNVNDFKQYTVHKSNKDANGIYTTYQRKRLDGTLIMQSVLSGGTSPQYTTRTETWYATNGTTVIATKVYTISYDTDGDVASEV